MTDDTSLARRLSVSEVVAVYEQAERDIRAGFALVAQAEKNLTDTITLGDYLGVHVRDHYSNRAFPFDDVDSCLIEVRRQVWQALVERLELRRFMSIAEWEKLEKELRDGKDVPEVTHATVAGMAKQFHDRMPEMLEQAVREVYDWLRPRGGTWLADYKTNDEVAVGRKVIINGVDSTWPSTWHVRHYYEQNLSALENVMTALDGKGQVTKTYYSALSTAIRAIPKSQPCVGATEYFRFRGFKKGTLHLEFLREDLLARFNQIAGGMRLRPGATEAAQ